MFKYLKNDLPASIVVFFVALPLCLGIALASGAPPFAGMIAGIIGGIIVGSISGSSVGVSGPAAGLAAIVFTAISDLGGYENFLVAVVIGGVIQILFGVLKAGVIGYYFPSSVIKGMLVGIGLIIIMKEIPYFFGYDKKLGGQFSFFKIDSDSLYTPLVNAIGNPSLGPLFIAILSLCIIIFWSNVLAKKAKFFTLIQGPFVVVVLGIIYTILTNGRTWGINANHLVVVPVPESFNSFMDQFSFPNFKVLTNPKVWITGFTVALVASLETLLCVEATDKIDPNKRITPTNRELFAQGTGNIISGLIGGLPITQVIVRSSANIQSGGQSKLSAIIHGFLLLISVIAIPNILNLIPLSVLAAILLIVGYKLAHPSKFKKMFQLGWNQWFPFIVTVILIVQFDLLLGIGIGLGLGILIVLYKSYQNSHLVQVQGLDANSKNIKIVLAEEVTFFNKGAIMNELEKVSENSFLEINLLKTRYIDNDIIEVIENFLDKAKSKNIMVSIVSEKGEFNNPETIVGYIN